MLIKETRQHGFVFVALGLGAFVVFYLQSQVLNLTGGVLSELDSVPLFARTVLIAVALFLSYRMIVLDYFARSRQFVEALPQTFGVYELVKFGLGFLVLFVVALAIWLFALIDASQSEPIGARFATIMASRLLLFTLLLWSVAFAFGMLGRWRVPFLLGTVVLVRLLDSLTGFEMHRFGPFALIDPATFPFERSRFPVVAMLETAACTAVAAGLGFAVALAREGSFMETLSRPLLRRERMALFVVLGVGGGVWLTSNPSPETPPIRFQSDKVLTNGAANVEVLYLDDRLLNQANALMTYLDPRMRSFVTTTGIEVNLAARVALMANLEADEFQTTRIDYDDGVVIGANFISRDFQHREMGEYLFHQLLLAGSSERAIQEERHWALDGFAQYWALDDESDRAFDPLILQALAARERVGLTLDTLTRWDVVASAVGEMPAMALGTTGWRYLAERHGDAVVAAVARTLFSRRATDDVRDWFDALANPVAAAFESQDVDFDTFVMEWDRWLEAQGQREPYRDLLREVVDLSVAIAPLKLAGGGNAILFSGVAPTTLHPRLDCRAIHAPTAPVPLSMVRQAMTDEEIPLDGQAFSHVVSNVYGTGTRIVAAVECEHPRLGQPLRFGATAFVMP